MGRKPLFHERKHPFYFNPGGNGRKPGSASDLSAPEPGTDRSAKMPEYYIERVLEGLSDACILVDASDRLVFVNTAAKTILRPKGRILGRKLTAIFEDRQISMLAADARHTGKPMLATMPLLPRDSTWREHRQFYISAIPLCITESRRLVRIALREAGEKPAPRHPAESSTTAVQIRNPLTIIQGHLENLLDGEVSNPEAIRSSLLTMRKHTHAIGQLLESGK